eukprot:2434843-Pyramimonas_sp.AAC.1
MLLGPLLEARGKRSLLRVRNVVDDITCQSCGPRVQVSAQLSGAVELLFKSFEQLQLPVEFKKCCLLYTSPSPRDRSLS